MKKTDGKFYEKMLRLDIAGAFFIIIFSVLLQNLRVICPGALIGIMLGSANTSIWEIAKTVFISYIIWSIIEAMCLAGRFHRYVVARVCSLYFLGGLYILLCLLFSLFDGESYSMPELTAAIASVVLSLFLSRRLMLSGLKLEGLFAPAIFMTLLFLALYCSLTPFPPHIFIFEDRVTGLYGIIPEYIDRGAIVLDTIYGVV